MSQEPDTGGQAFPNPEDDYHNADRGMTLLDWFAGQALIGLIATKYADPNLRPGFEETALRSYDFSAAMLAERKKRGIK